MYELKKINPNSYGKMVAYLLGSIVFFFVLTIDLFKIFIQIYSKNIYKLSIIVFEIGIALLSAVFIAFIMLLFSYIIAYLVAILYNYGSKKFGGLRFTFELKDKNLVNNFKKEDKPEVKNFNLNNY